MNDGVGKCCFLSYLMFISIPVSAIEKCQLAQHYFNQSIQHQANKNVKLADHYFDLGLSLHQLLETECDSSDYRSDIDNLIKQFTVNQRALCSSGVRNDCVMDANRRNIRNN